MTVKHQTYYVPAQSAWPIIGAIGLFLIAFGAGTYIVELETEGKLGKYTLIAGLAVLLFMLFGWFKNVITESMAGLYSKQMDRSFRQGMSWFIFSEVMFFLAFFGALFYARMISVPWLGGASNNAMTQALLWPEFVAAWPLEIMPDGRLTQAMSWMGLPFYNTAILLTSSLTLHFAHVSLQKDRSQQLKVWLATTIVLGIAFLALQVLEYTHAYQEMGLTLDAGIYGSTFFLLTGIHGVHVTLGTVFLLILFIRIAKGHFSSNNHFAFEAGSWYWHFVDVVWLCLFIFVYVL